MRDWSWRRTRRRLGLLVRLTLPYRGRTSLALGTLLIYTLVALAPPYLREQYQRCQVDEQRQRHVLLVITEATVKLVRISPARMLVVLGYPDMPAAADAVPALLAHSPHAIEGLDARLVDVVRRAKGAKPVPDLPRGAGWLMIEVGGETLAEAEAATAALVRDAGALDSMVFPAGPIATAMWQIRADGAGLAGRTPDGRQAWPGWEDAAVPPANLGAYLRDFDALMDSYGVVGLPYGHFGDGCIHVRIDLPMEEVRRSVPAVHLRRRAPGGQARRVLLR